MKLTINTQNVFFTSDWHLFHQKCFDNFDRRDLHFDNIHHMHEQLVERWNSVVGEDDYVFYGGDLSFGSRNKTIPIVKQLNGKIYSVIGNHDRIKDMKKLEVFEDIQDYYDLTILDENVTDSRPPGRQLICISHYPMVTWNGKGRESIMLHGHCHGNLMKSYPEYYKQKTIDVGCMNHDYRPLSYEDVINLTKDKTNNNTIL